jgi:hypothetical protein
MLYSDVLLAKVDASGNVEWARTYGAGGPDEAYGSTLAADGYLLAGVYSPVPGKEAADALLLKTSATGDLDWAKTFGGSKRNFFFSAVQTADGGYAAAGHTNGFGEGGKDILLIKLDEQGELLWARTYGGPEDESATSLLQTSDGGFAVVGDTSSFGDEESDAVILKTDGAGNLEWASAFGGPEAESSMSVIEPSSGNLTVLGVTQSYGAGKMDIFLLKLPEGRKSDDCTKAISPIQNTPNLTVAEPSLSSALVELEKLSDSLRKQQIATFE